MIVSYRRSTLRAVSSIEELEAAFKEAQAASEAYSAEVTERYRAEMPDPAEWRGPGPDPEAAYERAKAWTDAERAELGRLRTVAREAAVALHRARQKGEGHISGD